MLNIPKNYHPALNFIESEKAIKFIKDSFQKSLSEQLNLIRVTAPLFVLRESGYNDNLNSVERPVEFTVDALGGKIAEVVHSLAKWKRICLADYDFKENEGLYTDMNAIRRDEELSNIHSIYVDQWDWEKIINKNDRNIGTLKDIVNKIYTAIRNVEINVINTYPKLGKAVLPDQITFIHSQELLDMYPNLSPKERESEFAKKHGAIFIMGIGSKLSNGQEHDLRAPDYDDWTTKNDDGFLGLNGDIILYNPVLNNAFEVSSMGIRVNKEALEKQLELCSATDRKTLPWHKRLLNQELPQTIGGGIGQSRLCMFFLRKAHIGEVHSSLWPKDMIEECKKNNILIL